ncbi:PepSY domain-containing protein [Pedobacter sp. MR2016-19]|uniref:PepSY-associated TM helix domain-containing protein n=1 Tax=Pedobacter sp. MR2016-19 TaxID=2780089 RepID=UPI0018744EB3|nr:PepSY-associated TM helix domain-containing protein [Pedobacter sp. MR2016-19]MBE5320807.1 PepSY domain-containing protein [Pedobacter sp. MR2016-19]
MKKKIDTIRWAKHQKRWFGKWHTYLGIIAGIVVSFIAATGSLLVFQDEIDRALNPGLFRTLEGKPKLAFHEVFDIMKRSYPARQISSISLSEKDDLCDAYIVMLSAKGKPGEAIEAFIDPYNGKLCGKRIYRSSFVKILNELHANLMLSLPGKIIVGLSTLVLLILTISGLRLWIPQKWKQLKSVLTVSFKSSWKRQNYDWHNAIGFYTAPFVIVLCLTGFCMNLGILGAPVLMKVSGEDLGVIKKLIQTKSHYIKGIAPLPLKDILYRATKEMPDARVISVFLPTDSAGSFALQMHARSKIGWAKRDAVLIDQYSGKILFNSRKDFQQIGKAYLGWVQPLHYGNFGGMPTKIFAFVGGLSPLLLMISGLIIWWPRYNKQKPKNFSGTTTGPLKESVHREVPTIKSYRQTWFKASKQGGGYGLWIALISLVTGAIYGLPSKVIIEPALLTFYLVTSIVMLNFAVALITLILVLSAKGIVSFRSRLDIFGSVRYFALSLSISVVCLSLFFVLYKCGITEF